MSLFTEQINSWQDWGRVFQSISAFTPLVEHIMDKENLTPAKIENLTPGTNAVFKVGSYIVKIFAPAESGIDQTPDLQTELFAVQRANEIGVSAPKLTADGFVEDKYRFAYIITEYIEGVEFTEAVKVMTDEQKIIIGRKLRGVTDKMNTPCKPFNSIDVINDKGRYRRWDKYPERFKAERLAYLQSRNYGEKVFVHGDLCGDNILLTPDGDIYIIDFADAVLAPIVYEHALVAVELFDLNKALLQGYFGIHSSDELTEICFEGLLIHDFGGDIAEQHIGRPDELQCLEDLRRKLKLKIEGEHQ
jgi:thiamine kinase-like enzyme